MITIINLLLQVYFNYYIRFFYWILVIIIYIAIWTIIRKKKIQNENANFYQTFAFFVNLGWF